MIDEVGVVHGRFQLLHNEHMKYILEGKKRCKHLIIGICNPDKSLTKYSENCPHRSEAASNPFSYYERFQMIQGAMIESGISLYDFDIVPFPVNYPELIFCYTPRRAKYYMTIYDEWGTEKKTALEKIGCIVEVMWKKNIDQKLISGTDVRQCIRAGKAWKQYVPLSVFKYITEHGLDKRIVDGG